MTDPAVLAGVIARRLRDARNGRGWTLDELTSRSGVSRRMIVSIEQADGNPSIATLLRISDALGIGLPALVEYGPTPDLQVHRAGSGPQLWQGRHGGRAALVAGSPPPDVLELWDWTVHPGEIHHSEAHTPGTREQLLVLTGRLELHVGPRIETLESGDAAAYPGDLTHQYRCPAEAADPTRFVLSVMEPHVGKGTAL